MIATCGRVFDFEVLGQRRKRTHVWTWKEHM